MKVCVVVQWFPPEQAPIGHMMLELTKSLSRRGHDVTVITGFPNHPKGRVFGGYRKRPILREVIDGVHIRRVWLATSPNRTKLNRMLTFLSFTMTSCFTLLFTPCDVVFAVLQPLSMGPLLSLICSVKRAKLVLNVQDLHPDVPIELGLVRNPLCVWLLRRTERFSYQHCDAVTTICEGFRKHIRAKRTEPDWVYVIPNWIDTAAMRPQSNMTRFRQQLGLSAEHLVCLFAGTIGHVSGADVVLDAAERLIAVERIRFVFVGDGPVAPVLKEIARKRGLENVLFRPFQARERLAEVQSTADISVVTLKRGKGVHSVPSKVLGYMAAGRPVVASVDEDSETARQIRYAGCGQIVPAEEPKALADVIMSLADDKEGRDRMGKNGRAYVESELSMDRILAQYMHVFNRIIADKADLCQSSLPNIP